MWGQKWCKNIENYSELANRLERGRTYIRKNTIKSLTISNNKIIASVIGSMNEPYKVKIIIDPIKNRQYNNILEKCSNSIDNLEILLNGNFPKEYQNFFTDEKFGLFPRKEEIHYSCNCLDYKKNNHICKHIAATLYAIGNKLDSEPLIFFRIRGIDIDKFSEKVLKKENDFIWKNVNEKSNRKIDNNQLYDLFGIEYNETFNKDNKEKSVMDDENVFDEITEKNVSLNISENTKKHKSKYNIISIIRKKLFKDYE